MKKPRNSSELENQLKNQLEQSKLHRIDFSYVFYEFLRLFKIEQGLLFTIKEVLLRPGKTLITYLYDERQKYTKPLTYILFCALIYTFVFSHVSPPLLEKAPQNYFEFVLQWMTHNWGYSMLLISIFTSLWLKLLFIYKPYRLPEIIVVLCYVNGSTLLLSSLTEILVYFTSSLSIQEDIQPFFMILILLYAFWGIGQFFSEGIVGYVKVLLGYALGIFSFIVVAGLTAAYFSHFRAMI